MLYACSSSRGNKHFVNLIGGLTMDTRIEQVDVTIEQPAIKEITPESNPDIWSILQPPVRNSD